MKKRKNIVLISGIILSLAVGGFVATTVKQNTETSNNNVETTSTPIPTLTNTPIPTVTNTPTSIPTNTPTPLPTNTPTVTPTLTSTPIPTATNKPTSVPTLTPTNTPTPTPIPTSTPTPIPVVEHIGLVDGKISVNTKTFSKEIDKVMGEYGLDYKYKITIISNYYTETKDLDNTKIHDDILEKVIKEFKADLDADKKKEEDRQKQEDTFKNDTNQDAPDDWTPEVEGGNEDYQPAEGEFTIDLEANDALAGDGGELITDGKINGMD